MTFILNTLFDISVLVALFCLSRRAPLVRLLPPPPRKDMRSSGLAEKAVIKAAIATKLAERAFSLASTANLGIVALQRALQQPRILNKEGLQRNALAKQQVDNLFGKGDGFDWLYPVLDDESRDILEKAKDHQERFSVKK